ncbi:hypothetical protein [Nocardia sp. IFM 10818]
MTKKARRFTTKDVDEAMQACEAVHLEFWSHKRFGGCWAVGLCVYWEVDWYTLSCGRKLVIAHSWGGIANARRQGEFKPRRQRLVNEDLPLLLTS